jgi:hypothetical protein
MMELGDKGTILVDKWALGVLLLAYEESTRPHMRHSAQWEVDKEVAFVTLREAMKSGHRKTDNPGK